MKNSFTALSILIVAVSIFTGSFMISNSINKGNTPIVAKPMPLLMTETQVANYLGVPVSYVHELTVQAIEKNIDNPIPYIQMSQNPESRYYSKVAIDKWILSLDGNINFKLPLKE